MEDVPLSELAACLEQNSEHPIARGIVEKAREMEVELKLSSEFEAMKGRGIRGMVDGRLFRRGSIRRRDPHIPGHRSPVDVGQHGDCGHQRQDVETQEGGWRR